MFLSLASLGGTLFVAFAVALSGFALTVLVQRVRQRPLRWAALVAATAMVVLPLLAVLVAATSGVSAIIEPDGTVIDRTGLFTADALLAQIPLRTEFTVATRLGTIPERMLAAGALAGLSAAFVGRGRPPAAQIRGLCRRSARRCVAAR
ncbi:MAG: hypothetical protein ABR608_10385 [Pseudonocardiaceae bacterium]